jgi:hypothetical protein
MMRIEIPEARFYELPAALQEKIRVYGGAHCQVERGVMIWTLAENRYDEILAALGPTEETR